MNEFQIMEHYGEIARVLRHVQPLSADQVSNRLIQLYRTHADEVNRVMDRAIAAHATEIRENRLPATSAIILAVPKEYSPSVEPQHTPSQRAPAGTLQPTPATRRTGRKADVEANYAVADVLARFGDDWKAKLQEVCEALDANRLPLPPSAHKWRRLGCRDWCDVLAEDVEGLVKALQHRLDWVAARISEAPHTSTRQIH
jgi:hypothetical protein